jgi:uncharacterized protein
MLNSTYWIKKLNLEKHPEGGFYRRIYQSNIELNKDILPSSFKGNRQLSTSIYYLLQGFDVSVFHQLKSDEIWYYHYGSSATIHIFSKEGKYSNKFIGPCQNNDFEMQVIIPAESIFAAEVDDDSSYSLFGCMVSPGFCFDDFEIIEKDILLRKFPHKEDLINRLTR